MTANASVTVAERAKRFGLLTTIIVAHILAILWFVTRKPVAPIMISRDPSLIMIATSAGDSLTVAPPKPVEQRSSKVRAPIPPPLIAMPSPIPAAADAMAATDVSGAGGGGCQIGADMAAAILNDPMAMAELAALPPGVRSKADAVMIWNGGWADEIRTTVMPGTVPVSPVGATVREILERTVVAASESCRATPLAGPVLVPIVEPGRTTMLVIGSGVWRWDELLAPSPPPDRPINLTLRPMFPDR